MATSYVAVGTAVYIIADNLTYRRQEKPHKRRGSTPRAAQAVGRRDMTESRRVAVAVDIAQDERYGGTLANRAACHQTGGYSTGVLSGSASTCIAGPCSIVWVHLGIFSTRPLTTG